MPRVGSVNAFPGSGGGGKELSRSAKELARSSGGSGGGAAARWGDLAIASMARAGTWLALVMGLLILYSALPGRGFVAGRLLSGPAAAAAGAAAPAGPVDVQLSLGEYFFNPSVVAHRGVYLSTARTAEMKRIDATNWWFNGAYICTSAAADFAASSCRSFDPWQGRFQECLWGSERKVAEVDTEGLEDPKLFVWPGRGVYAVFGRKPQALGASPFCRDPVFVQFMMQVLSEEGSGEWTLAKPLELRAGAFAAPIYKDHPQGVPIKEKNWMPFVHDDKLHVTYSVVPHRVFQMNSTGYAVRQYVTGADAALAPFAGEDVHGGPPVVRVARAGEAPYYLGVLHFFKTFGEGASKVKAYHHYFYKTEAAPPFRICAVSKEIPLVTRKKEAPPAAGAAGGDAWTHQRIWKDTSQTAYASGLFVDGERVLLSYGSSDIDARMLSLGLADVDALFQGAAFDCGAAAVLDGGGEEAAAAGGGGGGGGGGSEAGRRHRRDLLRRGA
ncbi:hypothetical protein Rsub_03503 [Raphidocelis subcapitata]|uniref:Uncharacterized protein n=1 Tax=Raphidocelis subcapitata TaxID=307507 RepID=A0A2V0P004_9CHLO|nr:hypothetical protein Rsub_03503 [Raphidocelis subcapitata]|eukprot:GBF90507.1 hypothetical protein Rsub_03503 [Raphidocelis subcapitata]